ncbi:MULTISPECIES: glycosyltransferase family 4 protein [Nocardiaceae]|uniref:Glycosyltransferase family 4 protein n=1 Tax=Rhodococcoides kroppenstedtii TaxID=293050 RepID=A0ABS7NXE7_9NOCA|nr:MULTISPECIES: glycosyltransferase family 4 protein [Rhodococcus]AMY20482.1 Glycogen synthase [Rhodococcus sp. PBTS 1]MBY6314324.1 glycosyltransferase family 4 protein [Rhodococcus kroppenstedtii]MBY6322223.1 glycosyltransferase family 4 protein [Rhodococcus kroppenstedtii]MBY6401028.1 glycosyltransferase family 4 protein [Rhodococcus kroppenstedtii]
MKIAIVAPSVDTRAGGVERFAGDLSRCLSGTGHETRIFAPVKSVAGLAFARWKRRLGITAIDDTENVSRQLRAWEPDLVISNGTMGWGLNKIARRIHVFHGTMVANALATRQSRRFRDWCVSGLLGGGLCEFLAGWGATKVAVSANVAREINRFYLYRNIAVIPNAVQITGHKPAAHVEKRQPSPVVLFAGRREQRKGYEESVDAAARCGIRLTVAGPGDDDRTTNLGLLDENELFEALRNADALLFPTHYEGCSILLLEALAAGCPVVTTNVGWVPELIARIPEYDALVVDSVDPELIAEKLRVVLADRHAYSTACDNARRFVENDMNMRRFTMDWVDVIRRTGRG